MADKRQVCGSRIITYPSYCSYSCYCPGGNSPCTWTVDCGEGRVYTGTGLIAPEQPPDKPKRPPHFTVDGALADIAEMLATAWQRRVIVPPKLVGQKIRKRTLKGTPQQIAAALGLELGPRTKPKARPPKGDYVWIKG